MKRSSLLLALSVVSLVALAMFSSAAFAVTGAGGGAQARPAKEPKEKAFKEHVAFEAEYVDPLFGPLKCKETHVASKKYPGTETSGGADKFKCDSNSGEPIKNVTPGEPVTFEEWASDYFYFHLGLPEYVIATEIHAKAAHNGLSFRGTAVY